MDNAVKLGMPISIKEEFGNFRDQAITATVISGKT